VADRRGRIETLLTSPSDAGAGMTHRARPHAVSRAGGFDTPRAQRARLLNPRKRGRAERARPNPRNRARATQPARKGGVPSVDGRGLSSEAGGGVRFHGAGTGSGGSASPSGDTRGHAPWNRTPPPAKRRNAA